MSLFFKDLHGQHADVIFARVHHSFPLDLLVDAHQEEVDCFADGQCAGTQQQTHEAPNFPQQTQETKRLLHGDGLVHHAFVVYIHLHKVLPANKL